ncbi:hypothetical protein [Paenibacillus cremeus]|uniref:Uncharacterized protein n=1 Tax=Paenibacillus cremeus TaxID=2163881 RepID=A0A559KCJ1_9BACL|nr:hypothetical protein [Paenibacillus cremeus]TVY09856.1 hypothetical protein FPZ49_10815 [Paenibacillus cremeus]
MLNRHLKNPRDIKITTEEESHKKDKREFYVDYYCYVTEDESHAIITVPAPDNWTSWDLYAEVQVSFDKVPKSIHRWDYDKKEWNQLHGAKEKLSHRLPIIKE